MFCDTYSYTASVYYTVGLYEVDNLIQLEIALNVAHNVAHNVARALLMTERQCLNSVFIYCSTYKIRPVCNRPL